MFDLSTPSVVASKPTVVKLSTCLELEVDTKPNPTGKSIIKSGDWKAVLAQMSKIESDPAVMTVVLSDF